MTSIAKELVECFKVDSEAAEPFIDYLFGVNLYKTVTMKTKDFNDCMVRAFDKKVNRDAAPKGTSFLKYFSMNEAEKKVFLGGTCNGSTWRDKLIPALQAKKVEYFNPVVDDWTEDDILIEEQQKEICGIHIYAITPEMMGVYSIAEAVKSAMVNPKGTIFVVVKNSETMWSAEKLKSIDATSAMIMNLGATSWLITKDKDWNDLADRIKSIKRGFASTVVIQLQSHPIRFGGVHGIQVYDLINMSRSIIQFFNDKFGSAFNARTIKHLKDAKLEQEARTDDRKARKVEGYDKD